METKYRAWDKRGQRMWWNVQNAYDGLGNHQSPDPSQVSERLEDWFAPKSFGEVLADSNYVVMQDTGLKDKHGASIYDGDIVKCLDSYNATVSWDEKHTGWHPFGSYEGAEWDKSVEIIGNVYQHPHLLK